MTPEPKDKLDTTATVVVNGPEDVNLGWRQIDWRACEASVRRLRQRIFTASQAGDLKRVRNLQKPTAKPKRTAKARHFCPPTILQGLLEPCAGKPARTVLRGAGHSNVPGLPGRHRAAAAARPASGCTPS